MSLNKIPFTLSGSGGKPITGDLFRVDEIPLKQVLIFVHGFKGFKDWGFNPYLAEALAQHFGAVVTFNFSHNGIGSDMLQLTELENFKQNTFQREEDDLVTVIEAVQEKSLPGLEKSADIKIGVIGHSRAGASIIRSIGKPRVHSVLALVLLAAISEYPRVTPEEAASWRAAGVHYVENRRTNQMMPLGLDLLQELEEGVGALERFAKHIGIPTLIVHGDNDESVPVESAHRLAKWIAGSEKAILPGAGHGFGAVHPFNGSTSDLEKVISRTTAFLERNLSRV